MDYTASFTAGGILFNEFEAILPNIEKKGIKAFLQQETKENKYLKINTETARKRVSQEIDKRVNVVDGNFWIFYKSRNPEERKMLLFYLCIKTYQLVWDFHFKVTIPGYWAYHNQLDGYSYKMYLDELGSKDHEVQNWSESTRKKCIKNYMRMLAESGIVYNGKIQRPTINDEFYCHFIRVNELWALDVFLLNNLDKGGIINYCK